MDGTGDSTGHDAVRITLPDGRAVWSTDADADAVLSGFLGQRVTLAAAPPAEATFDLAVPEVVMRDGIAADAPVEVIRLGAAAPEGAFFDFAPVHLMTTSTLDRIAERSPLAPQPCAGVYAGAARGRDPPGRRRAPRLTSSPDQRLPRRPARGNVFS